MNDSTISAVSHIGTVVLLLAVQAGVVTSGQAHDVTTSFTTIFTSLPALIPAVAAIANVAGSIYRHYGMKKVPEASVAILPAAPTTANSIGTVVTGKVVGCLLAAGLVALAFGYASPAAAQAVQAAAPKVHHMVHHARIPLPMSRAAGLDAYAATPVAAPAGKLTSDQVASNPLLGLKKFSIKDLQAALDDANSQTPPDTNAAGCYAALMTVAMADVPDPLPAGPGFFQLAQKVRDGKAFADNLQSPNGPLAPIVPACAQWALDGKAMVALIAVKVGLIAGTGGLGGVLPAVGGLGLLPFKLP